MRTSMPKFSATHVEMPNWMFGGNPCGLGDYCKWSLSLADESEWIWDIQTAETVAGSVPNLMRIRLLSIANGAPDTADYDPVLDLATRDALQPKGVWTATLQNDTKLAKSDDRTIALHVHNVRGLLAAAPDAATLRNLLPELMDARISQAFPRASLWLVDTPEDALGHRVAIARALLRGPAEISKNQTTGTNFQSSQHLFNDTLFGFETYFTLLFTSLAPNVWGFATGRAGGIFLISFGELLPGDPRPTQRLLRGSKRRSSDADHISAGEEPGRNAFGATSRWWAQRLNLLFAEITNLANYADSEGTLSPEMMAEKLLSLEQFFRHCESISVNRTDSHALRVMLFTALETLAGVASSLNTEKTYDLTNAEKTLAKLNKELPSGPRSVLLPRAVQAVEGLRSVQRGFFVEERFVDGGKIQVRNDRGQLEVVPMNVAVRAWMRILRNSHHGFDKKPTARTRDLLMIHDGTFPDATADLAWLYLLELLTYPELVRRAQPLNS